jgi:hypothetical protein
MARYIFKNFSTVSFIGTTLTGIKNFTLDITGDPDRDAADDEKYPKLYGVQNIVGNVSIEMGDLWDVHQPTSGFSVGAYGSLRGTIKRKWATSTSSITFVLATVYSTGINASAAFGDTAGVTLTFEVSADQATVS